MAHLKSQQINWLDEAWRIRSVLAEMHDGPPGLLSKLEKWELDPLTRTGIELVLNGIALHLAYRIRVVHKFRPKRDGRPMVFIWEDLDPLTTRAAYASLRKSGVKFSVSDTFAIEARVRLGQILVDCFVCSEWQRDLPLMVASIGGDSTSITATKKAQKPRDVDRRGYLKKSVEIAVRNHPGETAWEILARIDDEVIESHRDGIITYWTGADRRATKSITADRYEGIFSEVNAALRAEAATGKRNRSTG